MSVKVSPRDRVVVTNFRHSPGNSISMFSLKEVDATPASLANGAILSWDGSKFSVSNNTSTSTLGGTYDNTGSLGGDTIQIRFSEVAEKPLDGSLKQGELAYSFLPDNWDGLQWDGGQTLYVGDENGDPVAIGSKRIYDYSNHADGITTANSFLIVGDDKQVDELKIGQVRFKNSTLSVENAGSNLYLSPGGLANISATDHRIIELADPINAQDAVTKKYLDDAIANFEVAPVTITDNPPANPDNGDLWYDSEDTFRLYVWNDDTLSWVDASPAPRAEDLGLIHVTDSPPADPVVGSAWYDADDTGRTYVWDGAIWVDMNPAVPQDEHVAVQDTPPLLPNKGDLWYDSGTTFRLYVWDSVSRAWIDASPNTVGELTHVAVSDTPPANPDGGDLWYDSATTYRIYVWDALTSNWVDASPNPANKQPLILIQPDPPLNPEIGTAWYDADGEGRTFAWDGQQWVDIAPQGESGGSANSLITIANNPPALPAVGQVWYDSNPASTGYARTFTWDGAVWADLSPDNDTPHSIVADTPPLNPEAGDLWYDSASSYRMYVWDALSSAWVDVAPNTATAQPLVHVTPNAPTSPDVGEAWYDSDGDGRTYVWDGQQWVDMNPSDVGSAAASSLAIVSDTSPLNPDTGLIWYNSNTAATDYGMTYLWDAAQWVPITSEDDPHSKFSSFAPANPEVGDIWINVTQNNNPFAWDGAQWVDINPDKSINQPLIVISNDPPVSPDLGTAWYDADDTGRTYTWDGQQWIDIAPNSDEPNVVDSRIHIGLNPPVTPYVGQVWFDEQSQITKAYNGAIWVEMANPNSGEPHVTIASTAPAGIVGNLWHDDTANTTMLYKGLADGWVPLANQAVQTNTNNLIFINNNPPASPDVGTAWYDADDTGRTYTWDGQQWVDIAPNESVGTSWVKVYENNNINTLTSIVVPVDAAYTNIVVTFEQVAMLNNTVTTGGVQISGFTTTANTYELNKNPINIFSYPFNNRVDITTFQDGLGVKPSTYLVNKYNETLQQITIEPIVAGDSFTSGTITVWAQS